MKALLLGLAVFALGCQISPVVTDPTAGGDDRYSSCRRGARDYCRVVQEASGEELDRCVAESTYRCLSGAG